MSNIIPKIRNSFGEGVGVEQRITPPNLKDNNETFVSTDASSGVSSFTVENGLKFSTSEFVLIGNFGAENAEILKIHTSTTPTSTVITLDATSNFSHNRGERIVFIPYDQIIIERSTDGGTSFSTLVTINIRADSTETYNQHTTGASTDLYRAKFSNSSSADVSVVSDSILSTGYVANSAGAVIRSALISMGEKIDSVLTKEFLFDALNDGRDEIDRHEMVEKWSFRTKFEFDAGDVIPGQFELTVPTDLRDPDTYKNVLSVRIGTDKLPLTQADKRTINQNYRGVSHTTLNGVVGDSDTSIVLTSSGDFADSGTIDIASPNISSVIDSVDYTGNTLSTATLTGITNIVSGGHATAIDVWQGAVFGLPQQYTVFDGRFMFSQPFSDELAGENIWLDYYSDITEINSDADLLDEPFFKIYIPYMRYRIKKRKNPDIQKNNDSDYQEWIEKREAAVSKEWIAQDIRVVIDTPDTLFPGDTLTGIRR